MSDDAKVNVDNVASGRIEKIKQWFKDPYNLTLVGILVLALAIRLYFLIKTPNQPLWYDEADYMASAKQWAFDIQYDVTGHRRPPLFQLIGAGLYLFNLSEPIIKFILVTI